MEKVGRNAPCPCGSGKKYKKCCLPEANRIIQRFRKSIWLQDEINPEDVTPEALEDLKLMISISIIGGAESIAEEYLYLLYDLGYKFIVEDDDIQIVPI